MDSTKPLLAIAVLAACLCTSCSTAPWTNGEYLHRYAFWGIKTQISSSDDYKLFPYHTIAKADAPFRFVPAPAAIPQFVEYRDGDSVKRLELDHLLRSTGTHAFIVVRDDRLLYEGYFNGYQRNSVCISRSMAKSFTSALVGIALAEGYIQSVDDPFVEYLPELKGQGFDSISIRQLLMMQSGIRYRQGALPWDDDQLAYFYPNLRGLLLKHMQFAEPPGLAFHYTDYNTLLLGMILERAIHRTPSAYLEEKIWKPIGMEYPATWSIDSESDGLELMHAALNARAIDFARFGRLYLNRGRWNGRSIIPERWVVDSTVKEPGKQLPWETYDRWPELGGYYKYQWWGLSRGADDYSYMAFGRYGQFIFVSPRTRLVIVRTGSRTGIPPLCWPLVLQSVADQMGGSG
jgi:CubicO group peptidase (beta-lactamase class C family)